MKKFFIVIISFILIISCSLVSFAADTFSLDPLNDFTLYDTFTNGTVSHVTYSSVSCTRFRNSSQSVTGAFWYRFTNEFVAGNSYTVTFRFASTDSNSNGVNSLALYLTNDYTSLSDGVQIIKVSSSSDNQVWTDYTFSFVYNGEYALVLSIWLSYYGNIYLTPLSFSRFNPNAALESAVDEQNSLIDEQNSHLQEGNSLIDEQNSLIDEQNSQLFDGTEEFTGTEDYVALEDSILESFQQTIDDIVNTGSDIVHSERLQRGTLGFTYFFNLFWQGLNQESLRWVRLLAYLSFICSILLLILNTGLMKDRADYNKAQREYKESRRKK